MAAYDIYFMTNGGTAYMSTTPVTSYGSVFATQYTGGSASIYLIAKQLGVPSGVLSMLYQGIKPTRTGYTFKNWRVTGYNADGSSFNTYVDSATASVGYNPTSFSATAQWTANQPAAQKVNVFFNARGGTVNGYSSTTLSFTVGSTYGSLPTPTRSGYPFNGWMDPNTGRYIYATSNVESNITTLEAQWGASSSGTGTGTGGRSTWYFNSNGGTPNYSNVIPSIDATNVVWDKIPTNYRPTKSNHTFTGWKLTQTGGIFQPGANITYVVNEYPRMDFVAQWTENAPTKAVFTITYQYKTSTYKDPKEVDAGGGNVTLISTLPSSWGLTGYTLTGWSTGTQVFLPGETIRLASNITLTAMVTEPIKKHTVTFDPNDGSSSTTSREYEDGKAYGYLPTVSRNDGGTFAGWFTSKTGGTQITQTSLCTGPRTVYAHWTPPTLPTPTCTPSTTSVKRGNSYNIYVGASTPYVTQYELQEIVNNGTVVTHTLKGTTYKAFTAGSNFNEAKYRVRIHYQPYSINSAWSDYCTISVDRGSAPTKPPRIQIIPEGKTATTNPVIYPNGKQPKYEVSWDQSIDVDNDLAGYQLEWCTIVNNTQQSWQSLGNKSTTNRVYNTTSTGLATNVTGIKYRVRAYDVFNNYSEWTETSAQIYWYSPPTTPPWIKVPDPEVSLIESDKSFKVSWGASTDVDSDLVSYQVERAMNGAAFSGSALKSVPATSNLYFYDNLPKDCTKVRYRVKALDAQGLESGYVTSAWVNAVYNTPPTTPDWIRITKEPAKSAEYLRIEWAPATDAENNLAGYTLEYTLDGGVWTTLNANTPYTYYDQYVIPKIPGQLHDTIAFRVQAFDQYNKRSGWAYSKTYNISNNASPVVTGEWDAGTYIGQVETGFSFEYQVQDEEYDKVDIEIWIDNRTVSSIEQKITPYSSSFSITERELLSLSSGEHTVTVRAYDLEGYGEWKFTFYKRGTYATLTLLNPMSYPLPIRTVTFTRVEGNFPTDCLMTIEVTNNAKEGIGRVTWEDCTTEARAGEEYQFKNTGQLFGWAFNFRIACRRGSSGQAGWISRVSGYFDTPDGTTVPFTLGQEE